LSEHIFIGVAWPYANGPLHLGHIAGAYLPADIFARYHRLKSNKVLMVSGSDQHGAPITIRAEQESTTPQNIADKYHQQFVDCWEKLGISFDLFTTTGTLNHTQVTHDVFLKRRHFKLTALSAIGSSPTVTLKVLVPTVASLKQEVTNVTIVVNL